MPGRDLRAAAIWFICLTAIAGCSANLSFSMRTFGAATIEDLQAEENYKATYATQVAQMHLDIVAFLPSGSNPGVCNKGGSAPDCVAADTKAIDDMRAMVAALEAIAVPPRFAEPDRLLRAALTKQIEGLDLRNQALTKRDDTLWQQHSVVLQAATVALQDAYKAFPEDNRPFPAP